MIKYCLMLLLFLPHWLEAKASQPTINNPFVKPAFISSEALEQQFMSTLNMWQYQGHIMRLSTAEKATTTIWLTDQQAWLAISDNTPVQLMPWQIISITSQEVMWQAELPYYCAKKLIITMKFRGK